MDSLIQHELQHEELGLNQRLDRIEKDLNRVRSGSSDWSSSSSGVLTVNGISPDQFGNINVTTGSTFDVGSPITGATGDVYYRNSSGLFTRLPVASNGRVLTLVAGLPSWVLQSSPSGYYNQLIGTTGSDSANGGASITISSTNGVTGVVSNLGLGSTGLVLNTPQDVRTSASPTFVGAVFSGLTASLPVVTDSGKALSSMSYSTFASNLTHANLTGLSADDHTQYALLAGRGTGQTLIGGVNASNNLTLQSTSNATRGYILANDQVQAPAGAVGAPGYVLTTALTSGLYAPANNQMSVAVNGSDAMTMAAFDNWGWMGTAVAANSNIKAILTNNSRTIVVNIQKDYTGFGGATISVLQFTGTNTATTAGIVTSLMTATAKITGATGVYAGYRANPNIDSSVTFASGTPKFYGFEMLPGTPGTVSGGTLTFTGFRYATQPSGYGSGGGTVYVNHSYAGDNIGFAIGNSEASPDGRLYSNGTDIAWDFLNSAKLLVNNDLRLNTVGNGLYIKEGTNATMGVTTLVAGTVVVNTTKVTANSRIYLTCQALGTVTIGQGLAVSARTVGTSFTILSQSAIDTSTVAWVILEPA